MRSKLFTTRNMVLMAMLAAIATVLMLLEFPLPFIAPSFYELDFSEVPILIGTFAMGPLAGVIIEFLKVLINLLINGTATAYVGEAANFIVGIAFVIPAGLMYLRMHNKKGAFISLGLGSFSMIVIGALMNAFVMLPWYASHFFAEAGGMDAIIQAGTAVFPAVNSVAAFVLLCVVPFNLIKCIAVSVITALLYKKVHRLINSVGKKKG